MASSWCLSSGTGSTTALAFPSPALVRRRSGCVLLLPPLRQRGKRSLVVCMAPEEERMTRRSPLDFPIICIMEQEDEMGEASFLPINRVWWGCTFANHWITLHSLFHFNITIDHAVVAYPVFVYIRWP